VEPAPEEKTPAPEASRPESEQQKPAATEDSEVLETPSAGGLYWEE
jgi:hypothetical protein